MSIEPLINDSTEREGKRREERRGKRRGKRRGVCKMKEGSMNAQVGSENFDDHEASCSNVDTENIEKRCRDSVVRAHTHCYVYRNSVAPCFGKFLMPVLHRYTPLTKYNRQTYFVQAI